MQVLELSGEWEWLPAASSQPPGDSVQAEL